MRFLLLSLLLWILAAPASGVLIDSPDGSANTEAPPADPGWDHVGTRGSLTAVYLGDGVVITANHVGAGDLLLGGQSYPAVPGSDVRISNGDATLADLIVYAVHPEPALPPLAIAASPPPVGGALVLIGFGRNRGSVTSWDSNGPPPPGPILGYEWGVGRSVRWGTNQVEFYPPDKVIGTYAFTTSFDGGATAHESQGVNGDSGGGVFAYSGTQWELAGLIYAIGEYGGQPVDISLYGQLTYVIDLSTYRDEIQNVIALPEPAAGLWPGALLVCLLARRRARSRATSRPPVV